MRLFDQLKRPIQSLAFAPDGGTLAAASRGNQTIGLWDLRADTFRRWHPHVDGPACSLAYSPDGKMLAVGGVGLVLPYRLPAYDYDSDCNAGDMFSSPHAVHAVAFAPQTRSAPILATASRQVMLWDFAEKESFWQEPLPAGRAAFFVSLAWSADDLRLAAGDIENTSVTVWKLNDCFAPRDRWSIQAPRSSLSVAFAPTGYTLALADGEGHILLYDVQNKPKELAAWPVQTPVLQVAFHPGGKLLATAGIDETVAFWDVPTQRRLACYDWKIGAVRALVFSPDGMTCAAGGRTGRIALWDVDV